MSGGWQSAQPARSTVLLQTPRWWCPRTAEQLRCGGDVSHLCSQLLLHTGSGNHLHRNQARRTASSAAPEKLRWWLLLWGDAAQIHELTQFFPSLLLLCFLPLFVKTDMTEGGGRVQGMEDLKLWIHLFWGKKKKKEEKKYYHRLPQSCPNK